MLGGCIETSPRFLTMPALTKIWMLLALAAIGPMACRRAKPTPATPPAPVTVPATSDGGGDSGDRERAERERLERERADRERALAELRRPLSEPIYFGFDRSDLTAETREKLEAKWAILSTNPTVRIVIEGHADDLGSDEYNLALGQRRAAAAKRYLTQRNIAPDRIEITSFGEERPTCLDATDACRERNRRDEVRITAGDLVTLPP
jgi:peptidoglycan-associated lipoprotein